MKKAEIAALEKVFNNEVEQGLKPRAHPRFPFQSKAKIFSALEADGLLRQASVTCGSGWMTVIVKGWELTEAGRLAYCMTCADEAEPKEDAA